MRELTITQFAAEYGCSRVNVYKRLKSKSLDYHYKVVGKMIIIFVPIKENLANIQSVRRKK